MSELPPHLRCLQCCVVQDTAYDADGVAPSCRGHQIRRVPVGSVTCARPVVGPMHYARPQLPNIALTHSTALPAQFWWNLKQRAPAGQLLSSEAAAFVWLPSFIKKLFAVCFRCLSLFCASSVHTRKTHVTVQNLKHVN